MTLFLLKNLYQSHHNQTITIQSLATCISSVEWEGFKCYE